MGVLIADILLLLAALLLLIGVEALPELFTMMTVAAGIWAGWVALRRRSTFRRPSRD